MRANLRDGALGLGASVVALVCVAAYVFSGPDPAGSDGERLMALSIWITKLGSPLSDLVLMLPHYVGQGSSLFAAIYLLLLLSVFVEWAAAAVVLGWLARKLRSTIRARSTETGSGAV